MLTSRVMCLWRDARSAYAKWSTTVTATALAPM